MNTTGLSDQMSVIENLVIEILGRKLQFSRPSAGEFVDLIEKELGAKARWDLQGAIEHIVENLDYSSDLRTYLLDLMDAGELQAVLACHGGRDHRVQSGVDDLLRQSQAYRSTAAFQELIVFLGRFKDYSPYNNLLVKTQNPACGLYATEKHWREKFQRRLVEDARPMVILQPRGPVLLVYDLDQTYGPSLPRELEEFASFKGSYDPRWLARTVDNARRHYGIRIDIKPLSSTLAGFATTRKGVDDCKRRVVIHAGLSEPSRFGVLCHELAHILLGHLGNDPDRWWPTRFALDRPSIEVEAEATAWIATSRLGLTGTSAQYISRYLPRGKVPEGISPDHIARVAGKLIELATGRLTARGPKPPGRRRLGRGVG